MKHCGHDGETASAANLPMKRQDVVFLIVENGGERSVRIKNEDGKTPLDLAKDMGWIYDLG